MSSDRFAARPSLFAGVSFADVWRAARYRQQGGHQAVPTALEMAQAMRFVPHSLPLATYVGAALVNGSEIEAKRSSIVANRPAPAPDLEKSEKRSIRPLFALLTGA